MKYKFKLATVFFLTLCSGWVSAEVKKAMLVVNYGDGTAIEHVATVPAFVAMMTALSTEHSFTLTITKKGDPTAQKQAALADMKNQDVVLFANIGNLAFTNVADQAIIQDFFANGGKAIGYHATIDAWHGAIGLGGRMSCTIARISSAIPAVRSQWIWIPRWTAFLP